ncbi:MAG: AAA family ATPase [Syntrophobacteraceae bacterium]|nr:AAA family ATPase [Syntrophobacteraceae bacterium]
MYLEFFKFKKSPFQITPDPDFLFLSPGHKEASASIFYGIQERKGFVAVTGEVGVGKTTILRSYLNEVDQEKTRIVYLFNSILPFEKLLKQICSELGIQTEEEEPSELVELLFGRLIDEYRQDHNVVLIIDEAQNMPVVTFERLRMLSNLETSQDKLIQILLVGQPELDTKLNLPELRQLKQRIAVRAHIESLTCQESFAYILHRLMRASSFHNPVFTQKAMKRIVKEANGIPRTINILCDNALVAAFGYNRKPVDAKIVNEVIADFRCGRPRSGFGWKKVWRSAVVASFAAIALVSASLVVRFQSPPIRRQCVSGKLPAPPPEAVRLRQSGYARLEKVSGKKTSPALPERLPGGSKSGGECTPAIAAGIDTGRAVVAKTMAAAFAVKSNTAPAAFDEKFSTRSATESKTGAPVGVKRVVVHSSDGISAPAALKPLAARAIESLFKKASETPATPAESTTTKTNGHLDTETRLKGEPAAEGKHLLEGNPLVDGKPLREGKSLAEAKNLSNRLSAPAAPGPLVAGARESLVKAAAAEPRIKGKPLPSVVVRKGDTVSRLLFDANGKVDEKMIRSFQILNPQVKDINKILTGGTIFLPTDDLL